MFLEKMLKNKSVTMYTVAYDKMFTSEHKVRKRCVCVGGILRACQFRYYLLFFLERHLRVFEHMYVVACRPVVFFSIQAVVSFSLLCLSTVRFCLELI